MGRLERALSSVNVSHKDHESSKVTAVEQLPSRRLQLPRLDSMPPLSIGSDTSSASSGPPSPGAPDALLTMLERLTGATPTSVHPEILLEDLGIDSLAAVEFATELTKSFEVVIDGGDLVGMTVGELRTCLKLPPSKVSQQSYEEPILSIDAGVVVGQSQPGLDNTQMATLIIALLAETTGLAASAIKAHMTLDDLGLDSLAMIEVCTALSKTANQSIEPDDITSDMTVAQVLLELCPETAMQQADVAVPLGSVQRTMASEDARHPVPKAVSRSTSVDKVQCLDMPSALRACETASQTAAEKCGFTYYWSDVGPMQDRLTIAYILEAMLKLGINMSKLECGAPVPDIPHPPRYTKLAKRVWDILSQYDIVEKGSSGRYQISQAASKFTKDSSSELHKALLQKYPQYAGEANLMQITGPKVAECLADDADAVKLLFGNDASSRILEDYYGRSPMLSCMTAQLASLLAALFDSARGRRLEPFHILEVGAGTGGTTGAVVEMLRSRGFHVTYTFTDISPSLVSKAKRKFDTHKEWMSFERLDLERPVSAHLTGKFDVVFATNCVHATKDRVATCSRIREMLNPNGFMILSEVTRIINWYDIVFGLLDGWWLSAGGDEYPLQPPHSWMADFEKAGFLYRSYTRGPTEDLNTQRLLIGGNSVSVS